MRGVVVEGGRGSLDGTRVKREDRDSRDPAGAGGPPQDLLSAPPKDLPSPLLSPWTFLCHCLEDGCSPAFSSALSGPGLGATVTDAFSCFSSRMGRYSAPSHHAQNWSALERSGG